MVSNSRGIIAKSSNVGVAKLAEHGKIRLYEEYISLLALVRKCSKPLR